jgi:hypothetical protein
MQPTFDGTNKCKKANTREIPDVYLRDLLAAFAPFQIVNAEIHLPPSPGRAVRTKAANKR